MAAKIYFYYGTMNSSKTAQILMRAHNYQQANINILLAKPKVDTRTNTMWSRIGIEAPCMTTEKLFELSDDELKKNKIIIIDEAQFLSEKQVNQLVHYADDLGIIIMCYGLKTDFTGKLFEGSQRLIEVANELNKIETTCWCGEEAEFNALIHNGKVRKKSSGSNIEIGDEQYVPLCRKHYFEGRWKK